MRVYSNLQDVINSFKNYEAPEPHYEVYGEAQWFKETMEKLNALRVSLWQRIEASNIYPENDSAFGQSSNVQSAYGKSVAPIETDALTELKSRIQQDYNKAVKNLELLQAMQVAMIPSETPLLPPPVETLQLTTGEELQEAIGSNKENLSSLLTLLGENSESERARVKALVPVFESLDSKDLSLLVSALTEISPIAVTEVTTGVKHEEYESFYAADDSFMEAARNEVTRFEGINERREAKRQADIIEAKRLRHAKNDYSVAEKEELIRNHNEAVRKRDLAKQKAADKRRYHKEISKASMYPDFEGSSCPLDDWLEAEY